MPSPKPPAPGSLADPWGRSATRRRRAPGSPPRTQFRLSPGLGADLGANSSPDPGSRLSTDPSRAVRSSFTRHGRPAIGAGDIVATVMGALAVILALGALLRTLLHARRRHLHLARMLQQARYEADHDRLTGLPNRRAALARLEQPGVAMIGLADLDRFKEVNDRHGHQAGDDLLVAVAHRLQAALGHEGMVARLAGDEFVLIWGRLPHSPQERVRSLLRQVGMPLIVEGHLLHPRLTIGLAHAGTDLAGVGLLAAADHAMYEARMRAEPVHLYGHRQPPGALDRNADPRRSARPEPDHTRALAFWPEPDLPDC